MRTIWKFPLEVVDEQKINMPVVAKLLTVQLQGDRACLWALVDPETEIVPRRILLRGTGHSLEPDASLLAGLKPYDNVSDGFYPPYVGTFQLFNGGLVFHVFDGGRG